MSLQFSARSLFSLASLGNLRPALNGAAAYMAAALKLTGRIR